MGVASVLTSEVSPVPAEIWFSAESPYMAAIWLIVIGILRLIRSSRLHQFHKTFDTKIIARRWWVVMLNGILLIVLGIPSIAMTRAKPFFI